MAYNKYTDEQQEEYVTLATEMGIGPAMRQLGYPGSYHTAQKWLEDRGLEITVDTLKRRAVALREFYGARERMTAAMTVLDRVVEACHEEDLNPEDINKLANALQRVIQTMQLIEGDVTDRRETITKDGADLARRRHRRGAVA